MLQKDIQKNQNELNQDLIRIIDEIGQLKKDVQEQDLRLINKKKELSKALRMKTLFSAIQICATIISFLNSRAALIGSLVKLGFGVLEKNNLEYLKEIQAYQDDFAKKTINRTYNSLKYEVIDLMSARKLGVAEIQTIQSEINSNYQRFSSLYATEKK